MKKLRTFCFIVYAANLASCATTADNQQPSDMTPYSNHAYGIYEESNYYYPQNYSGDSYQDSSSREVKVPDSYHVGAYHSPTSHKDRDRNWVSSQNPQAYTIELADDEKAAQVAKKLYQAPKNDRTAQIKYYRNGKAYYKGVYGTYNSQEEAQKALESLPEDVKNGAGIKNWQAIQGSVGN